MSRIELSRQVDAPSDAVWEVIAALDDSPETISGIHSIERVSGPGGFDVGTRWRETRTVFGKEHTEEMEVTGIDPGSSYTVEADGRGARYTTVISVDDLGAGRSQLAMSLEATPTGLGSRIMTATIGRLFAGATKKMIRQDLDDIARASESRSG